MTSIATALFGTFLGIVFSVLLNAADLRLSRRYFPKRFARVRKNSREWRRLIRMYAGKPLTLGLGKGQIRAHLTPHARLARLERRQRWQRRQKK